MQLVNSFLEQSAQRLPDKVCLVCDSQRLTYQAIDGMANRLANALVDHGVQRGDRVVLFMPNSVELVVAIFAVLKADAIFVVVNSSTKEQKLEYVIGNCRAAAAITTSAATGMMNGFIERVPSLQFVVVAGTGNDIYEADNAHLLPFDGLLGDYPASRPRCRSIDRDLACLIYTSGSTGDPKGVMSAHSNVVFAATSITTYLENTVDDVIINVLPFSFDYGLYQLLMAFKMGARLVLERSFAYPSHILKIAESERITGLPGVPTMFSMLLQMDLSKYDLSSLRYLTNTAAALPGSHIQQIRRLFPHATLYSMYGLTETKRTLYLPPEQLDVRPDSVGIAIPGTEVWVEGDDGERLGAGRIGELVARGGHVMCGYWENPEATAERYRPGPVPGERVCYTGDLFRMDDEGYLYFVGRKDDIIKSRGEKVAPKEVENVLYMLPEVTEAAVVGVPDPILGEAIKAFVVVRNGALTENDVLGHCRSNLEDFMMPKYVELCDELPKNPSGKIDKLELTRCVA